MKKNLVFCIFWIMFASCTQLSSEYKRTKQENDSLKLHILKNEVEMNELLSTLNAVEEDIHAIQLTEDLLLIQNGSELTDTRREQLKKNMNLISESLKKNRQKLAELQEKMDASSINFSALQKTVDRLAKEMDEKNLLIITLRSELDKKEVKLEELAVQIEELNADVRQLEGVNLSQSDLLAEQDQALNTVYYCFGTKKELKEQNILTGGGLFSRTKLMQSDFNYDYFLTIDKRKVTSIQLYSSKAAIKTNHPSGSYHLVKDMDGKLVLEINYPILFWSLSHFLVIEVR